MFYSTGLKEADDRVFMEAAIRLAEEAARSGEVPVGAVLVDVNGDMLAEARNMVIELCDPAAHAEIVALRLGAGRTGNYRLTDATLYVTIEPCPMCAGAMVLARIGRLVFGAHDPKTGACGSLYNVVQDQRLNHRIDVKSGVLEDRCRAVMQDFFKGKRKG
ncbi:MAG: tRNA adenosine(34) deaminase TadA [Desulfobacteraceae bacterium]|nr:tRNA adenosine(34) deaminase TadA [Desulfobacteraceae bacterium]